MVGNYAMEPGCGVNDFKTFVFSPEVFGFGSTQIELCSGFLGGIFCLFVCFSTTWTGI